MEQGKIEERKDYIDIAKGIGILLVLFGHLLDSDCMLKSMIYSFHMPLFFLVSGWVHREQNMIPFIKKRIQNIAIPYFLWALIFCEFSIQNLLLILYGSNETLGIAKSNGMLWFLVSMFVASIVGAAIIRISNRFRYSYYLILIFSVVLLIASLLLHGIHSQIEYHGYSLGLPWGMDISLMAGAFYLLGYLLKKGLENRMVSHVPLVSGGVGIILMLVTFVGIIQKTMIGYPQMATYDIGNPVLFFVIALLASIGIIWISYCIETCSHYGYLRWAGKNSLLIFIMHRVLVSPFRTILANNHVWWMYVILFACLVAFSSVTTILIERYLPFLAGRRRG